MSACDECETATFDCTTARAAWPPRGRGGASTKHSTSDIAELSTIPNTRADDSGLSLRGLLGRILTIRLRRVHLVAHFFHLTKNAKSVGSENLFDVRRAIAAIE
jgi:hypothetical protein